MKWRHWKKWALVGGIILIGCSARFLSISQIEKNSIITISDSDVFQQWEIRAAIQQTAADFTIWHPPPHKSMQLLKHFLTRNPSARPNGNAATTAVNEKISS